MSERLATAQLQREGANRFGERWSEMSVQMMETIRACGMPLDTDDARTLLAQLTWNACMTAWGLETAHSAHVPCSRESVGVLIMRGQEILLVERLTGAVGHACIAGHVEPGEGFEAAAARETREESGLEVTSLRLIAQGRRHERCKRMGSTYHDWRVYQAEVAGYDVRLNPTEARSIGWYDPQQLAPRAAADRGISRTLDSRS
jgi:ADP-ribose pyrophosphatase YjhB (NUDIX family)